MFGLAVHELGPDGGGVHEGYAGEGTIAVDAVIGIDVLGVHAAARFNGARRIRGGEGAFAVVSLSGVRVDVAASLDFTNNVNNVILIAFGPPLLILLDRLFGPPSLILVCSDFLPITTYFPSCISIPRAFALGRCTLQSSSLPPSSLAIFVASITSVFARSALHAHLGAVPRYSYACMRTCRVRVQ